MPGERRYGRKELDREDYRRQIGCGAKVAYRNERVAHRAAANATGGLVLYPYACRYCKGWHLSKQRPPEAKPAKERKAKRAAPKPEIIRIGLRVREPSEVAT